MIRQHLCVSAFCDCGNFRSRILESAAATVAAVTASVTLTTTVSVSALASLAAVSVSTAAAISSVATAAIAAATSVLSTMHLFLRLDTLRCVTSGVVFLFVIEFGRVG